MCSNYNTKYKDKNRMHAFCLAKPFKYSKHAVLSAMSFQVNFHSGQVRLQAQHMGLYCNTRTKNGVLCVIKGG